MVRQFYLVEGGKQESVWWGDGLWVWSQGDNDGDDDGYDNG